MNNRVISRISTVVVVGIALALSIFYWKVTLVAVLALGVLIAVTPRHNDELGDGDD